MHDIFPVIDISTIADDYQHILNEEDVRNDAQLRAIVEQISNGFSTWGFLYIRGHDIPQHHIDEAFNVSKNFFLSSHGFKMKFARDSGVSTGYVPQSGEVFDKLKPPDIKEAFDFVPISKNAEMFEQEIPDMSKALKELYKDTRRFLFKLLRLLAVALNMDIEHFVKLHANVGNQYLNGTNLRTLYYPETTGFLEANQSRCTAHTDYGTITVLFQDSNGGLEVCSPTGEFVEAVPIPGTVVINAGDLFSMWCDGKFPATVHRVTVRAINGRVSRQSMAFFSHPDFSTTIQYKDENGNVSERNAGEHLKHRYGTTLQ